MTSSQEAARVSFDRAGSAGLLIGVIGVGLWAAGLATAPESALLSWLFSFTFWMALTLGCLGVALLHHSLRGAWGLSVLRIYEAAGGPAMFAMMAVAFLPILLGMGTLYHEWLRPDPLDAVVAHKAPYLNQPFFIARTVAYFAIWIALAYFLRRSSLAEDETRDPRQRQFRTNLGTFGLVLLVFTMTFAITDWVMSLDPHWFSSIYGPWYVITGASLALGFGIFLVCTNAGKAPYNQVVTPHLTKDLGNMLFAFTQLWAYFTLSQFIIIWSGNLPKFIAFYDARREAVWAVVGGISVIVGWFVPFIALLSPKVKATASLLAQVALIIVLCRGADIFWNVLPMVHGTPYWTDLAALAGLGGLWTFVFATQIKKAALLPAHDTRLIEQAQASPHHA
jgi:hypothetical protein